MQKGQSESGGFALTIQLGVSGVVAVLCVGLLFGQHRRRESDDEA
ncbi:hypothetical protein U5801_21830 [Lamprobacter modestohalophilus]|nr:MULTISPECIES: hypothetical protein [Chromatiaceae]MEA1052422.1 hypothetical protein [Lamprobacter modestohalophilus]